MAASLALSTLALTGCGDDGVTGGEGGSGAASQGGGSGGVPTLPTLDPGWNEFLPGGDTICARGTEYAYFVHPGTVNKVIVDFIGGGACWNQLTCSVAGAIFSEDVEDLRDAVATGAFSGIYDKENPDNPFKDWYHVVIPYCTGDIHWGDAITTYDEGPEPITINHKGAVNTRTVLDWVYQNFSAPEQVLVTGCSAGSYGSALWSAHVMQHYASSQVIQFGDSGAGIITQEFFQDSFPSWSAEQAFPSWIPELDPAQVDLLTLALPDLYKGIANHYPQNFVSQYNTAFDDNQHFYYEAMGGGDVDEWSQQMLASIAEIDAGADNFASFIAPGEQHCIILYDNFYTVNAGGVRLVDWLRELVDQGSVESVSCTDCTVETP